MTFSEEKFHFDSSALTGRQRIAHKPNSKPKSDVVIDLQEEDEGEGRDGGSSKGVMTEEELWARLDELEKLEALQDEQDRYVQTYVNLELYSELKLSHW